MLNFMLETFRNGSWASLIASRLIRNDLGFAGITGADQTRCQLDGKRAWNARAVRNFNSQGLACKARIKLLALAFSKRIPWTHMFDLAIAILFPSVLSLPVAGSQTEANGLHDFASHVIIATRVRWAF